MEKDRGERISTEQFLKGFELKNTVEKKARRKISDEEYQHQKAFFQWRELEKHNRPELAYIHSSLNGVKLAPGVAGKAKASGLTSGVWDVFLPLAYSIDEDSAISTSYVGLYIEFKSAKGTLSKEQKLFGAFVAQQGYYCAVVRSWTGAAKLVVDYIDRKRLKYPIDTDWYVSY